MRYETVKVNGVRRQRLSLIDIPQLARHELRAVIRNGVCADLAWAELKKRGGAALLRSDAAADQEQEEADR